MDLETVKHDIEQWIVNFVEVPHPALGGWPPCPYARSARMKKSYDVRIGVDPYFDLKNQARWGMGDREVIIYVYDPVAWPYEIFSGSLKNANHEHLLKADIIALEDHPADQEIVNGVCVTPSGVNERDLDLDRTHKLAQNQKLAFFPPHLQPPMGATISSAVPLDREAGLKAYANAEKPSQAKKRQKY